MRGVAERIRVSWHSDVYEQQMNLDGFSGDERRAARAAARKLWGEVLSESSGLENYARERVIADIIAEVRYATKYSGVPQSDPAQRPA
jgi:hypothetical protein